MIGKVIQIFWKQKENMFSNLKGYTAVKNLKRLGGEGEEKTERKGLLILCFAH